MPNYVDSVVISILSPVYTQYCKYWVDVLSNCYGCLDKDTLMFDTEEEAKEVNVGYKHSVFA